MVQEMQIHNWDELDPMARAELLRRPAMRDGAELERQVREILETVRRGGDRALLDYTRRFDNVELAGIRVGTAEMKAAETALDSHQVDAIRQAAANVERFHEAQLPARIAVETVPGVLCERLLRPLDAVGLYVPAGTAPLPSAVIMLAIPARVAGCPQRVLCTPPNSEGNADPAVLVAAKLCGVTEIFKLGGAQAVAAMAFGTESVPKVDKIFGPGNSWVTAAKMIAAQMPGGAALDLPAGPSEVLVLADSAADPEFIASDLLSQAEHGTDSQVVLVTTSKPIAVAVAAEVERQLVDLPRAEIARAALAESRLIVVKDRDEAIEVSNQYAPEHLIIQTREPREWLQKIRHAGSVFLGPWTPESVGDYCSGTNHVLPTYGFARNTSGLGVDAFVKLMTVQQLNPEGLRAVGPVAETLAQLEGLDAHARAVSLRLSRCEAAQT
jgi:histidinol dehydrogenase